MDHAPNNEPSPSETSATDGGEPSAAHFREAARLAAARVRAAMAGMPDEKVSDYYLANPLNLRLTDNAITQVTLLQGGADTIVPISQARHPNARIVIEPGAGHFDWIHPQSAAFQTLLGVLQ